MNYNQHDELPFNSQGSAEAFASVKKLVNLLGFVKDASEIKQTILWINLCLSCSDEQHGLLEIDTKQERYTILLANTRDS